MRKKISQTAKKDMLFGLLAIMVSLVLQFIPFLSIFFAIVGGMGLGGGLREAGIWK